MGYSSYSRVVFGLKVSKDDLIVEEKVRSCNHNTDLNANFCSVCGQPVYEIEETMIVDEGYYPNKLGYFVSDSNRDEEGILGFVIVKTNDQDINYYAIPEPKEEMVKQLKDFLIAHDFQFEDKDLKSYLYTRHSY